MKASRTGWRLTGGVRNIVLGQRGRRRGNRMVTIAPRNARKTCSAIEPAPGRFVSIRRRCEWGIAIHVLHLPIFHTTIPARAGPVN